MVSWRISKVFVLAAGSLLGVACSQVTGPAADDESPADDSVQQQGVNATDAGRADAAARADGAAVSLECTTDADCRGDICRQNKCVSPTYSDGIKGGTETDVDCGGAPEAPKCAVGKSCQEGRDCDSAVCAGNKCQEPKATDGARNGTETDVDCGGGAPTNAPKCAAGKKCKAHGDCLSDGCNDAGRCAVRRSCTQEHGGRTCGSGEVGQPGAKHEDCCESVALPSGVKLDKYKITDGRIRKFIERTGGNVRGYIQANTPAGWNNAWNQYLPVRMGSATDAAEYQTAVFELGPLVHGTAGGGNQGCYISNVSPGARTYWMPQDVNTAFCAPGQSCKQNYAKDILDEKPINCVSLYMLQAFCAWDGGGSLPSPAELEAAWGTRTYPWGASPAPSGYNNGYPYAFDWTKSHPNGDVTYANYFRNYWWPAQRVDEVDSSIYIAAPGRFPKGAGPLGHMDIAGALMEWTSSATFWKNGSWEGHGIGVDHGSRAPTHKYISTGGRCRRP